MRCVKPGIHDIQERKKHKHYYMLHVKRLNQRNYYMLYVKTEKFSLGIFTNIIAELVVDNALCENIFAKCFQLLFN